MSERSNHIADAGPSEVVVYVDMRESATTVEHDRFGRNADTDLDTVLAWNGWRRTSPWTHADDMPDGHTVAAVEPAPVTVDPLDRLSRDQAAGRIRRVNGTPL